MTDTLKPSPLKKKEAQTMMLKSIEITRENFGEKKGKYTCNIAFTTKEGVRIYAEADEIVTAELIKVLIPVFEKISNQKYEEIVEETEDFLRKFNFRKRKVDYERWKE